MAKFILLSVRLNLAQVSEAVKTVRVKGSSAATWFSGLHQIKDEWANLLPRLTLKSVIG